MYDLGQGVEQDFKEAVKWFQKAADQGDAAAQNNLAGVYFFGDGDVVEGNFVIGYAWILVAEKNAARGKRAASIRKSKGVFAFEMNPEQIAKAQELSKEMVKKNPKLLK